MDEGASATEAGAGAASESPSAGKEGLLDLVLEQMRAHGWGTIPREDVTIQNVSGGGGGRTFKVVGHGVQPVAVALHKRSRSSLDQIAEERAAAAAKRFSEVGLAPRRLCEGEDWFIDIWEGAPVCDNPMACPEHDASVTAERPPPCSTPGCAFYSNTHRWHVKLSGGYYCCLSCAGRGFVDGGHDPPEFMVPCERRVCGPGSAVGWADDPATTVEELGALLARVHGVPTSWFDDSKRRLLESIPALRGVPQTSALWWWAKSVQGLLGAFSEEGLRQWAEEDTAVYVPRTEAARRVVTCHGDFHGANVLRVAAAQLKVIDFENSTVMLAAMDLAWAFAMWCKDEHQQRRLLGAYLEASGPALGGSDADAVWVDVRVFQVIMPGGPGSMAYDGGPGRPGSAAVRRLCADAARMYRESPEFRASVHALPPGPGVVPWSPSEGLLAHITTHPVFVADKASQSLEQRDQGFRNQGED